MSRIVHRAFVLLLAAAAIGCGTPPADHVPASPAAPASSPAPVPSAPAIVAPVPLPAAPILAARVEEAYGKRARGEEAAARAAFDEIVQIFSRAGVTPSPGLGAIDGYVVEGPSSAGLTFRSSAGFGTLFFDLRTGKPFAFAREVALRGSPLVDEPFFVTEPLDLHDPIAGRRVDVGGVLIAVHPDGHRAYVLDTRCRVVEWSISSSRLSRRLGPHKAALAAAAVPDGCAGCGCNQASFERAVISADGRRLSSRWGRWSLVSGVFAPLPIKWSWTGYHPAMSPDGRYIAYLRKNPRAPRGATSDATLLSLLDQDRGTTVTAQKALPAISNGDPLSFDSDPPSVHVVDYARYAFSIPDLSPITQRQEALCVNALRKSKTPPRPDLLALLAARVCSAAGFVLPAEHCADAR